MMYLNEKSISHSEKKLEEMQKEVQLRGITRLCHITQINNLVSILSNDAGLLSAKRLAGSGIHINDRERYDGKTNYVSCSVEYPNYRYYKRKRFSNPECTDWAVLLIDKNLLCEEETLYCPFNAAQGRGSYLSSSVDTFKQMFAPSLIQPKWYQAPAMHVRTADMPAWHVTYDQAEVMIKDNVQVGAIQGIVFESPRLLMQFKREMDEREIQYPALFIAPELFQPIWAKTKVGIRPEEVLWDDGCVQTKKEAA